MRKLLVCSILSFGAAAPALALDLDVSNHSQTAVHQLFFAPSSQTTYGPDQLGKHGTIEPGQRLTLTGIEPGNYDVKLVTADGTTCEVQDADFSESKEWKITEHMLDHCE